MTLRKILNEAKTKLEKNKIENAEYDARQILLNLLDIDMSRFLVMQDDELEEIYDISFLIDLSNSFDELINIRANKCPLQYILGETYFCGLKFEIDDSVLIPRQDTEVLVEKVLFDNPDKNKYVLDLCTGSGCIAIALASIGDYKLVVGSDISREALNIASKNANEILSNNNSYNDEIKQQIYFLLSDLFNDMNKITHEIGIDKFDIITANPPYIKTSDINSLQDEVKNFEPLIALDGDSDGLKYYKDIANNAKNYLTENGYIYLEIGFDQAEKVKNIFESKGYIFKELVKDFGGNDRVIVFQN